MCCEYSKRVTDHKVFGIYAIKTFRNQPAEDIRVQTRSGVKRKGLRKKPQKSMNKDLYRMDADVFIEYDELKVSGGSRLRNEECTLYLAGPGMCSNDQAEYYAAEIKQNV